MPSPVSILARYLLGAAPPIRPFVRAAMVLLTTLLASDSGMPFCAAHALGKMWWMSTDSLM